MCVGALPILHAYLVPEDGGASHVQGPCPPYMYTLRLSCSFSTFTFSGESCRGSSPSLSLGSLSTCWPHGSHVCMCVLHSSTLKLTLLLYGHV